MPDPAAGKFEMPGGHCEGNEAPRQAAMREWQEETGLRFPDGEFTATWDSANGIYQGFVYTIASEADLDIFARQVNSDPDGDVTGTETIAWWDPGDLPGNPAVRPELLSDIDAVMAALGAADDSCCNGDCCSGGCCQGEGGCPCAPADVAKASDARPKDEGEAGRESNPRTREGMTPRSPLPTPAWLPAPQGHVTKAKEAEGAAWPGWKLNGPAVAYWAPKLSSAVVAAVPRSRLNQLASDYLTANPAPADGQQQSKRDRNAAAAAWLTSQGVTFPLGEIVPGIVSDGYVIGVVSATALVTGSPVDTGGWKPGAPAGGLIPAALLATAGASTVTATETMGDGYRSTMGRTLADGADSGLTAAALGAALASVLADGTLAASLIADQITAASGQAAQAAYSDAEVEYGRWLTDPGASKTGPCPICLANEAAGRVRIGDPYPSGDVYPPAHPGCACATGPA